MKPWLQKNYRLLFYGLWLLLSLMQASLTELQDDEAYYWVYSQYPDWGYFDHPPMIAILVKAGYAIFPNELGIRFFPVLLNVFTLVIIEKLLDGKNPFLFFAIALSMAVIQLMGFMAVPDIPLIFFTALFFYIYRRFLEKPALISSLLLGLSIALLLYSKYPSVLIVLLAVAANPRLLTRYHIWLAGFFALLLFIPHLWWQYQHDWISFRYHLFESNVKQYKISYTLEYLVGQLFLPGPLGGFILLPAAFLYKPKNSFEKSLRYTLIGILAFFLVSSFRGKTEANWTAPILIPLMVLSFQYLNENVRWKKLFLQLLPASLLLILFARIVIIVDIIPVKFLRERYHAWKGWPEIMIEKSGGNPVVFGNYYQLASKFWFYSKQPGYAQSYYRIRKNNFKFWPVEDSLLGKPVFVMDKDRLYLFPDSIKTPLGWIGYKQEPRFLSFSKIKIKPQQENFSVNSGQPLELHLNYTIPDNYLPYLTATGLPPDTIHIGVFNKKGWIKNIDAHLRVSEISEKKIDTVVFDPRLPAGNYFLRIGIQIGSYYPAHNSSDIKLEIKLP